MSSGVPKSGQRTDFSYFLFSSYFILNTASLLVYPLARYMGMRQRAIAMMSESVSTPKILTLPFLAFRKRQRIRCHSFTWSVPSLKIFQVLYSRAFPILCFPVWKNSFHFLICNLRYTSSNLLWSFLLFAMAGAQFSKVLRSKQIIEG